MAPSSILPPPRQHQPMFREHVDETAINASMPLQAQPVSPIAAQFGAGDVGYRALGPTIAFTVLATVTVALRWYTRALLVRCIGLDDYVILISLMCAWTMCIIIGVSVHEGVGQYEEHMNLSAVAKLILVFNTLWSTLVNITKASILAQYLRIFGGRWTRRNCYFTIFLLLPAASWGAFGAIFLCTPVAKIWDPVIPGHCRNAQHYWASVAAIDIFLDVWTLLTPMPSIASLRLPPKQKIATMFAFLLGFAVCIVGVARLATVLASAARGDYIMSGIWAIIWSSVEGNICIICASFLSLKALVARLFPRFLEDTRPSKHSTRLPPVSPAMTAKREWTPGDPCDATTTPAHSDRTLSTEAKPHDDDDDDDDDGRSPSTPAVARLPPACMPPAAAPPPPRQPRHKPTDSRNHRTPHNIPPPPPPDGSRDAPPPGGALTTDPAAFRS